MASPFTADQKAAARRIHRRRGQERLHAELPDAPAGMAAPVMRTIAALQRAHPNWVALYRYKFPAATAGADAAELRLPPQTAKGPPYRSVVVEALQDFLAELSPAVNGSLVLDEPFAFPTHLDPPGADAADEMAVAQRLAITSMAVTNTTVAATLRARLSKLDSSEYHYACKWLPLVAPGSELDGDGYGIVRAIVASAKDDPLLEFEQWSRHVLALWWELPQELEDVRQSLIDHVEDVLPDVEAAASVLFDEIQAPFADQGGWTAGAARRIARSLAATVPASVATRICDLDARSAAALIRGLEAVDRATLVREALHDMTQQAGRPSNERDHLRMSAALVDKVARSKKAMPAWVSRALVREPVCPDDGPA